MHPSPLNWTTLSAFLTDAISNESWIFMPTQLQSEIDTFCAPIPT